MDLINQYFTDLTSKQKNQFIELEKLYSFWNEKINVISRKNGPNFYVNHVLHSLAISKVCSFKTNTEILDVGTGGGFPGIPLAILHPESKFKLIDSIGKKILVTSSIVKSLDLHNVQTEKIRAEEEQGKYDFIVSRAVTQMPKFISWVRKNVKKSSINEIQNGILYLKGGDLIEELKSIKNQIIEYEISNYFNESFFQTKKVVYVRL